MFVDGPRTPWSGGGPTEVKALAVVQGGGGEHGSGSGFDAGPCRLFTQFARGGWERVQDLMQDLQVGTFLLCYGWEAMPPAAQGANPKQPSRSARHSQA